jgi:hypothetical protein
MADSPQDLPRHVGHVVRRALLRRNIAIDPGTAQLVAAAVQAALQAGTPSRPPRRRAAVLTWHRLSVGRRVRREPVPGRSAG